MKYMIYVLIFTILHHFVIVARPAPKVAAHRAQSITCRPNPGPGCNVIYFSYDVNN